MYLAKNTVHFVVVFKISTKKQSSLMKKKYNTTFCRVIFFQNFHKATVKESKKPHRGINQTIVYQSKWLWSLVLYQFQSLTSTVAVISPCFPALEIPVHNKSTAYSSWSWLREQSFSKLSSQNAATFDKVPADGECQLTIESLPQSH